MVENVSYDDYNDKFNDIYDKFRNANSRFDGMDSRLNDVQTTLNGIDKLLLDQKALLTKIHRYYFIIYFSSVYCFTSFIH